jgi:UDP-N-acetylmuramoyl-L-alanyl-D-glutamate--2,6-diaminopimelate ligase
MIRPTGVHAKSLSEIAEFLGQSIDFKDADTKVYGICSDSRVIRNGDLFLALPGEQRHGIEFIKQAIKNGAVAVLTNFEQLPDRTINIPVLTTKLNSELPVALTDWFFDFPSKNLHLFGITGTNGKTTTTYLLHQIFQNTGNLSAVIGTVAIEIGLEKFPANRTTPTGDEIVNTLARMRDLRVTRVAMEVSSHALSQKRIAGLRFASVGFTNLSQDHLDYHGTMENYFKAKAQLFSNYYSEKAFINIDNEYGPRLFNEVQIPKWNLSLKKDSDWSLKVLGETQGCKSIAITGPKGISISTQTNLIGVYNLENLLLAVALAVESGIQPKLVESAIPMLSGAPGRLEKVLEAPVLAYVDYAHTPDAVERVLAAVRKVATGRVIGVLGCGGDRDRTKRAAMGMALNDGCDLPIFTSDNPRSEPPELILQEMVGRLNLKAGAEKILDRRLAIRRAAELAEPGDLLIILGKGHETGQEINGEKYPFDDRVEIREAFGAK